MYIHGVSRVKLPKLVSIALISVLRHDKTFKGFDNPSILEFRFSFISLKIGNRKLVNPCNSYNHPSKPSGQNCQKTCVFLLIRHWLYSAMLSKIHSYRLLFREVTDFSASANIDSANLGKYYFSSKIYHEKWSITGHFFFWKWFVHKRRLIVILDRKDQSFTIL